MGARRQHGQSIGDASFLEAQQGAANVWAAGYAVDDDITHDRFLLLESSVLRFN
jgi:hypothetical protein